MGEQELEILQGAVSAVVYQNYENGYAVLRLNVGGGQTVTVVGTIPLPAVGERLMVTGKWSNHSNYGRQFEAEFLERLMPQTTMEILNYLSSRVIKGIGPKMAARIVERFGDQTLAVMEREPERLAEVAGISREKARAIGEEFRLQVGMRQIMEFFALHHLPAELAVRTYKRYGDSTIELLYDDPYLLMDEELEADFAAVDQFAIDLGVAGDDPRRVEAGVQFELNYNLTGGHSFLPEDKLAAATARLLHVEEDAVRQALERLLESGALDAFTTPIGMKKSRPGVLITVLCREETKEAMVRLILKHTTTLGVREFPCQRYTLSRSVETVNTPYGPVRKKVSSGYGIRREKYEYEDLAKIAREQDCSIAEVLAKICPDS